MADIRSLDLEPLASITLADGNRMEIPRLTTSKVIRIAKFLAVDGMKIYSNFQDTFNDPELTDAEKVGKVLNELTDQQIIHLLSVLLNISDEEALAIDPFDTLEIITVYADKIDLERAQENVKKLMNQFRKQDQQQNPNQNQMNNSAPVGTSS